MSKIPVTGARKIPTVANGLYEVECLGTEDVTLDQPDIFGKTDKIRVSLGLTGLVDEEGEPIIVDPLLNRTLGKKATLRAWAEAFGVPPTEGQEFETNWLVGCKAQALIQTEPEDADGTRHWPRVTNLLALPKARANGGSRPSQRPVGPLLQADDGAEAISKWWAKTRAAGLDRKEVIEQSKFAYDGREPAELTGEELDSLYQMVAGV